MSLTNARTSDLPKLPTALLLDFDGVILESVELKIQAFLTIYENEDPAKLAQILDYQRLHGGITRRLKFRYFETHLFGRPGDAETIERLSAAYTRLVHDAVLVCPFVPGAIEGHGETDGAREGSTRHRTTFGDRRPGVSQAHDRQRSGRRGDLPGHDVPKDGYMEVPNLPGMGLTLNMDYIAEQSNR
jgi:hypothetical protein